MGYVVRLTEANHYESIAWVLTLLEARINFRTVSWRPFLSVSEGIALRWDRIGLRPEDVEHMLAPIAGDSHESSPDESQHRAELARLIRFKRPKICPACLREDSYCRRTWDLLPITLCTSHRALLVDRCPRCDRAITWFRKAVSQCACGYDWRDAEPIGVCDERALRLVSHVQALAEDGESIAWPRDNPFSTLSLLELSSALFALATASPDQKGFRTPAVTTDNARVHSSIAYAARIVLEWPGAFESMYARALQTGTLIRLEGRISKFADRDSTVFIQLAFDDEARRWAARAGVTPPAVQTRFMTFDEARSYLAFDVEQFERLLGCGRLRIVNLCMVDVHSLRQLLAWRADLLDLSKAASLLGLPLLTFEDVVIHRLIKPSSGPEIDGFPTPRVSHDELIEACTRFEQGATIECLDCIDGTTGHRALDIPSVIAALARNPLSITRLLEAIADGVLSVLRHKPEALVPARFFHHFAVCETALRTVIKDSEQKERPKREHRPGPKQRCERVRDLAVRLDQRRDVFFRFEIPNADEESCTLATIAHAASRVLSEGNSTESRDHGA